MSVLVSSSVSVSVSVSVSLCVSFSCGVPLCGPFDTVLFSAIRFYSLLFSAVCCYSLLFAAVLRCALSSLRRSSGAVAVLLPSPFCLCGCVPLCVLCLIRYDLRRRSSNEWCSSCECLLRVSVSVYTSMRLLCVVLSAVVVPVVSLPPSLCECLCLNWI